MASVQRVHIYITCNNNMCNLFTNEPGFWNTCHYHKPIHPCLHFKMSFMYNYNVNDYKNNVVCFYVLLAGKVTLKSALYSHTHATNDSCIS